MFRNILVAVDQSSPAAHAIDMAVKLATEAPHAHVVFLHVIDTTAAFVPEIECSNKIVLNDLRAKGDALIEQIESRLPKGLKIDTEILEGEPAEVILQSAKQWPADLIVIGSDSRGRLAHFLLGSTADSVIRRAPCPVMSVRAVDDAIRIGATEVPETVAHGATA